jgi:hypothetical protein
LKIGSEDRKKVIMAAGLGVVALLLIGHWLLSSDSGPTPSTAAAVSSPASPAPAPRPQRGGSNTKKVNTKPRSLDPTLRFDWLRASEDTKYEGKGRNIFLAQVDIPAPVVSPVTKQEEPPAPPPGPPPPPPPPPINLKFFGFASKPGEPKRVFLSEGEDVFIAGEGEIVDRRYKIVRITPMAVEVEDVLNNNRQSIPLTQGS